MITRDAALAIVNALRSGTVPPEGLEHFAVGLDPLVAALREQRQYVAGGRSAYRFLRGPYGSGKTFLASLAAAEALDQGWLTSKVVISVADTPLFRLDAVYRRLCQGLCTPSRRAGGALQSLVDRWLFGLEAKVVEVEGISEDDPEFAAVVARKVQQHLVPVGERAGRLAACLSAYHQAQLRGDFAAARGLVDWMAGEAKVGALARRGAGVTGKVQSEDVLAFLRGLLELARDCGHPGLLVVLDEVETILRLHRPERLKSLEVLRQLVDALDRHEFPGLHLLVTGTPDFFQSAQGVPLLEPLHDRIRVEFREDRPDNLRQAQVRLQPFDRQRLLAVARRVRALYPAADPARMEAVVDEGVLAAMADRVTSGFGGRVEVVPRLFLRELVGVLDLVDQYPSYSPASEYRFQPGGAALTPEEEDLLGSAARELDL